jgi:hypothetical protein
MNKSNNKLFAKLGHGFANDPKIIALSDSAFRAYVESLLFACSNMTDGFLDERILRRYGWLDHAEELTTNDAQPSWIKAEDGYQIHAFCDWQMTTAEHEKKVIAGRAGGLAKAENQQSSSKPLAGARKVLKQNASKRLLDKDIEVDIDKDLKPLATTPPLFDEFWKLWPRKDGKANAIKAWLIAVQKLPAVDLVEAAREYSLRPDLPKDKTFIPHASTWLNGERWQDEVPVARHHPPEDDWMYEHQTIWKSNPQ